MKTLVLRLILSLAVLFLPACQSTALTGSLARGAVTYAVIKVVQNNPASAPRIIRISGAVRAVAGTASFDTVGALDAYIRSQVDWSKLKPEDAALGVVLIDAITAALQERIGPGKITSDKLLVVADVATWIETAARTVPAPAA